MSGSEDDDAMPDANSAAVDSAAVDSNDIDTHKHKHHHKHKHKHKKHDMSADPQMVSIDMDDASDPKPLSVSNKTASNKSVDSLRQGGARHPMDSPMKQQEYETEETTAEEKQTMREEADAIALNVRCKRADCIDLRTFVDVETKTLSLSQSSDIRGDEVLRRLFYGEDGTVETPRGPLFFLLETSNDVENLDLDGLGLKEIPKYLIVYFMFNRHLVNLSLQNNDFNIPGVSNVPKAQSMPELSAFLATVANIVPSAVQTTTTTVAAPQIMQRGDLLEGVGGGAAAFISDFLQEIVPMAEASIQFHIEGGRVDVFRKLIRVHKDLPPIAMIDQRVLPHVKSVTTKKSVMKEFFKLATTSIVSLIVGLVPYAVSLIMHEYGCDNDGHGTGNHTAT